MACNPSRPDEKAPKAREPKAASASAAALASKTPPAPASRVIALWPEGVPDLLADAPPERVEDERVYNVSVATLSVFPAPRPDERRAGVIVCPGGGYVR